MVITKKSFKQKNTEAISAILMAMVAIFSITTGLLSLAPSAYAQVINHSNIKTTMSDKQQIMAITSKFYRAYLNDLNQPEDDTNDVKTSMVKFLQKSGVVDNKFISNIDKLVQESLDEVGFVEVNPIIWAQDIPLDIKVSEPTIQGNNATIMVYSLWSESGNDKQLLLVKLHKLSDGWKIYDIVDGGMV